MKSIKFSGNESVDYSQYTQKTLGGRKLFALIMAILAAVSDFALLIVFAISGHGGVAIAVILLILDALFITGVCLSNLRLKYAVGIWVTYIAVSVVVTSILAALESGGETYMTNTARCLNIFAHLALYIVTVFACIYPLLKSNIKVRAIMISCVAAAVIMVSAFTAYFCDKGYFGQGFLDAYRVVGYTLDEESDTYIASSVKMGRSGKVVIPATFNGKKVSGVNCSVFTYSSIKSVDIEIDGKINFVDTQLLENINSDLKIGVDKKYIDVYRKEFLKTNKNDGMRMFSNCMYPVNLEDDERYITFEYDAYPEQKNIIPTWIGKAGEEFAIDFADGVEYLKHADANVSNYIWCYENNDAKILVGDMLKLAGDKIDVNKDRVKVEFANVYKVKIQEDNDSIYEPSDSFKTTVNDGRVFDCRFITVDSANAFVEDLSKDLIADRDNGFDLKWIYKFDYKSNSVSSGSWRVLDDLSDRLNRLSDTSGNSVDIELAPVWTMKNPTDLNITLDKAEYIYGDNVTMRVSAKAPVDDFNMEFEWGYTGNGMFDRNNSDEYVITNAFPQYGTFCVYIVVTSDKSSLTSLGYVERVLQVKKRPLNITWQEPSDMVFDNTAKVLQHSNGEGELINGDVLTGNIEEYDVRNVNAGRYTARLKLIGDIDKKYVIATGGSHAYTISPCPTQVQWTCGDYTYDGNYHNASATAKDVEGRNLLLNLSASKKNAGRYTATVSCDDKNYLLTDAAYEFEIKQKPVTVTAWSNAPLTYSGMAQHPDVVTVDGVVGYENINNQLIYSGYSSNIDAGEGYTVNVELPSTSNYKFDTVQSTSYNIGKRALSIQTLASDKVYDGNANTFDFAIVYGLASVHTKSSLGTPIYSGSGVGAVDADNYSVTVALPNNDVTKNYEINYSGCTFNITKAQVALSWSDVEIKDGVVTPPRATVSGVTIDDIDMGAYIYKDSGGAVIDSIPYENGNYSVEVNPTSKNYTFTNTRINFTVTVGSQNREVA